MVPVLMLSFLSAYWSKLLYESNNLHNACLKYFNLISELNDLILSSEALNSWSGINVPYTVESITELFMGFPSFSNIFPSGVTVCWKIFQIASIPFQKATWFSGDAPRRVTSACGVTISPTKHNNSLLGVLDGRLGLAVWWSVQGALSAAFTSPAECSAPHGPACIYITLSCVFSTQQARHIIIET